MREVILLSKLTSDLKLISSCITASKEITGKGYVTINCIRQSLSQISPLIAAYLAGRVITLLTAEEPMNKILSYAFIAAGTAFLIEIINIFLNRQIRLRERQSRIMHDSMLAKKSLELDYAQAESPECTELRSRISDNSRSARGGILVLAGMIPSFVSDFIAVGIALFMLSGLALAYSPDRSDGILGFIDTPAATVVLIIICVVFIGVSVLSSMKTTSGFVKFSRERGRAFSVTEHFSEKVLNENKSGKDIRIYNEAALIEEELEDKCYSPFRKFQNQILKVRCLWDSLSVIALTGIGGIVYIFVGLKALAGALEIGKVVEYYAVITHVITCVNDIASKVGVLKSSTEYLELEMKYLNLKSEMTCGELSADGIDPKNICFEFHHVSFTYPGTDMPVLNDICLKINSGEKLAVVGLNGSGKSTMIKLLCRLYDPDSGSITVNGTDIKSYRYEEYLKLFSVVFQDFKLLAFSVAENVAANDVFDPDKVLRCLETAGLRERVEKMPNGINQAVYKLYEKDGIDLSGGEEQKLAIARALYKDAPFVILDEPTAALDPIAESEIYQRFGTLVTDRTSVFVSHRLSSCRFCDRILVFDNGRIIEEGTHDVLVSKDGRYAEMWNAQAQYYQ